MDKIIYLSYYDIEENKHEERAVAPSAVAKMQPILQALEATGNPVEIVSMSATNGSRNCPAHVYTISENRTLRLFSTLGRRNILTRLANRVWMKIQLYHYMFRNCSRERIVLAYHALPYLNMLMRVKRLKHCKLILEMEEIYGNVSGDQRSQKRELALARIADGFIFPTPLMDQAINTHRNPVVILPGTYSTEKEYGGKKKDGKIHVVYAGILDPRKGGAAAAVEAVKYLPQHYHMHILGFGTDAEKRAITEAVERNCERGGATLSYDGVLSGEVFFRFLQSCHIGLSTQNPEAAFNTTSFPSKILTYMANGLRVVSIRIDVVEASSVGDMITYYDAQTPEELANAITSVDMEAPYDIKARLESLHKSFTTDLKAMVESVRNG